jgi:hypothetical protein
LQRFGRTGQWGRRPIAREAFWSFSAAKLGPDYAPFGPQHIECGLIAGHQVADQF